MLEVYRVKDLEYSHEKRQAKELIDLLSAHFKGYQNEKQYIVIDPRTNGLPQTEAILYFRGYTIILELKDYKRRIYPKLYRTWEAEDEFGNIQPMHNQGENPFHQVRRQRSKYIELFARKVFDEAAPEISGELEHKIKKNLCAWIVTSKNSEIILNNLDLPLWNGVFPLNHELTTALYQFGKEPKKAITEKEFLRFTGAIGAVKPPSGYWNTGPVVPELENSKSYIVEKLLQSSDLDEVKKGLDYSKELKLISNFELIETSLSRLNDDLREYSYRILFDWIKEYPNKFVSKLEDILRSGLSDKSNVIRRIALEYLALGTKLFGTEMLQFLQERLREERWYENIALIVKAMEFFEDRSLITEILKNLYDKWIFQDYYDKTVEGNQLIAEREEIVGNKNWVESKNLRDRVSDLEKRLGDLSKHISNWDNVLKALFEVSITLGLKDMGNYSLAHFQLIYETHKGGYERFTSLTNEFGYTLDAISSLKPEGVSPKLVIVLHETSDDYLKYLIVGALGDLGDSSMIKEIRPFLGYNDEMGDVDVESMKVQASDSLSKLGDLDSFDKIWKLYVLQKDKENRAERDKSYIRSLRRLDRQRTEVEIWKKIEGYRDLEKALATYSKAIRDCGGELSFEKLKNILIERGDIYNDWWYSPSSTIIALPWLNPFLKEHGLQTGLEFLQSGREELEYVGLELSEEYFLSNESELEKYETSKNDHILNLLIYFYSKKGNKNKILKFLRSKVRGVPDFAFYRLAELVPENHYQSFHLIRGNHVFDCEFIVTETGIALQLENVVGYHVQWGKHIQFLPWSSITGMKSIFKEKSAIGFLFTYDGGGSKSSALVPRDVAQWNYLISNSIEYNSRSSEIGSKINSYLQKNRLLTELTSTSELLLNILKKAFMKEQEISDYGRKDSINHMSNLFDEYFKEDLMHLS